MLGCMKKHDLFVVIILFFFSQTNFPTESLAATDSSKAKVEAISCQLTLKDKDPQLAFIPKSIDLKHAESADGKKRWDLTLSFETYFPGDRGENLIIPQKESALLEYSCLKKGCTAITRPKEKADHSSYLTQLYFKNFSDERASKSFSTQAVIIGRNPYGNYVDVPVEVTAKCKAN